MPFTPVYPIDRVTLDDIEGEIVSEHYFDALNAKRLVIAGRSRLPGGLSPAETNPAELAQVTFCLLVLRNGCIVVGVNTGPVDPAGFDAEYGRNAARADAIRQIWPRLGFRLLDRLHRLAEAREIESTIDGDAPA